MRTVNFDGREVAVGKVVCVGRNYAEHIAELGNELPSSMVLFAKPNSAVTRELRAIEEGDCHYECEICFIVREGRFVGVGLGLDLTKRAVQTALKSKGLPWERAKAFDGAAVFGDFVACESADELHFEMSINGELRQKGGVADMIYKPAQILDEVSSFMSLDDGDVVMSGTPKGVSTYKRGDRFEARLYSGKRLLCEVKWEAK
jgi:2-keto-4-pentenoate hydratase/2-oxohepta-3-ene-1,7-dioic acid hydratase in catechol pathway